MTLRFALAILLLVPVLLATGCYEVPVTGRSAINLVSDKDVKEKSLEAFAQAKKKYRQSLDKAMTERVERVGSRLSKVVFWDVPDADWEFVVFDVPNQINAFAMPGGKVAVYSGLFKIIENDDQLASVLAHEIAHVAARHTHERFSQAMLAQTGSYALQGAMVGSGSSIYGTNAILQAYGLGAGIGVIAFDRGKEQEADQIGLMYMARAGYHPEEAIKVMERLDAETAGNPARGSWFSTHPDPGARVLKMQEWMPKAMEAYRNSGKTSAPVLVK